MRLTQQVQVHPVHLHQHLAQALLQVQRLLVRLVHPQVRLQQIVLLIEQKQQLIRQILPHPVQVQVHQVRLHLH